MTLSQSESHDSWLSCRKRFVTPGKKTEMLLEKPDIQGLKVVSWPDLLEINVAGPWLDLGLFEGQVKVQQHLFLKDLMSVDLCSRHGSVESGLLMTHCVSTQLLTACHLITVVCKVSSAWCLYISSLIILVELLCLCVCAPVSRHSLHCLWTVALTHQPETTEDWDSVHSTLSIEFQYTGALCMCVSACTCCVRTLLQQTCACVHENQCGWQLSGQRRPYGAAQREESAVVTLEQKFSRAFSKVTARGHVMSYTLRRVVLY